MTAERNDLSRGMDVVMRRLPNETPRKAPDPAAYELWELIGEYDRRCEELTAERDALAGQIEALRGEVDFADDALTAYRTAYVHLLYHAYPITGEEMHQHFTKRFGLPATTTQDMSSGAVTQDEYHVCEACAAQRDGEGRGG